jgi:hypothetical protein
MPTAAKGACGRDCFDASGDDAAREYGRLFLQSALANGTKSGEARVWSAVHLGR